MTLIIISEIELFNIFFIHLLLMDTWVIPIMAIVNRASMNIKVCISFRISAFEGAKMAEE